MPACGVLVEPHNVAVEVDPKGLGFESTGDFQDGECAVAQQKGVAMDRKKEVPHDVALGVDARGLSEDSRLGDVNGGERALAQQKAMSETTVPSHDVALGVDPRGIGVESTRHVEGG